MNKLSNFKVHFFSYNPIKFKVAPLHFKFIQILHTTVFRHLENHFDYKRDLNKAPPVKITLSNK